MTSHLLEWSLIQNKQHQLNPQEIKVKELIESIAQLYNLSLSTKQIQIQLEVPDNFTVHADKNTFTIAIRNIMSNAIKFSPKNETIKVYLQDGDLIIQDAGMGMDENLSLIHI